jgi:acyl-CoA synthetase (AMP-forming)/AMP-acid ligase II
LVPSSFGIALLKRIDGEIVEARSNRRIGGGYLKASIVGCAQKFREVSDSSPGPVLVALDVTLESAIAYLGALVSGRTLVPVDVKEGQEKVQDLIDLIQPAVCWFPSGMTWVPKTASSRILRGIELASVDVEGGSCPHAVSIEAVSDDLLASARILVPTSGSTGKPSLVRITDENLFANTVDIVASQTLTHKDRSLLCLPLSYCFGASVLHTHLWVGGSVVVDGRMMFPEKVLDSIEAERCSTFAGVPTSFLFLQSRSSVLKRKLPNMRLWLQAGGYLSADVVHAFCEAHRNVSFAVMYGQTEATARIASFVVDGEYPYGCVGYPMASLKVQIRGEDGAINGPGIEGEVWICGPSVSPGYFGDPEHKTRRIGNKWMDTGDIGYMHQDGRICISGRSNGFIKIRGRRVGCIEIEEMIWQSFAVRCCACAVPDPSSGEKIGLLLERQDHVASQTRDSVKATTISEQMRAGHDGIAHTNYVDWAERVQSVLPPHWDLGPVICGELPLTSSGKINRKACFMLLCQGRGNP